MCGKHSVKGWWRQGCVPHAASVAPGAAACVLLQVIVEMLLMCADLQLVILGLQLLQGAAALSALLCFRGQVAPGEHTY